MKLNDFIKDWENLKYKKIKKKIKVKKLNNNIYLILILNFKILLMFII